MLVKTCFFPLAPKKIQMNSFGISIAPHLFRTLFDFNNYFLGAFDVDFFVCILEYFRIVLMEKLVFGCFYFNGFLLHNDRQICPPSDFGFYSFPIFFLNLMNFVFLWSIKCNKIIEKFKKMSVTRYKTVHCAKMMSYFSKDFTIFHVNRLCTPYPWQRDFQRSKRLNSICLLYSVPNFVYVYSVPNFKKKEFL